MIRRALLVVFFFSVPFAVAFAGVGSSGCGGCYVTGDSHDAQIDPPSACITVAGGHSTNGCAGPRPSGVGVSNGCSDPLVVGGTTLAPGQNDVTLQGGAPASGNRRSLAATLGAETFTISWVDAVEASEGIAAATDAATDS